MTSDELKGSVLPAPEVESSVGQYELIGELARGGIGTVYLCRRAGEAGFTRLFALKVLHTQFAEDEDFVKMLVDEAHIAALLHHPNVVSILDLGTHAGGHFVVMEYIEGPSLAQLLKRARDRRPPRTIVPIMIDTLRGLHAAHTLADADGQPLRVVHRDVSPQNILVGVDGTARITDFGIAKAEARSTQTRAGVRKGKLQYMSPEQLRDDVELDPRSDVFAAGIVLWSALTGLQLFRGDTNAVTIQKLLHEQIAPPSTVGLRPPACLDEVCMRALRRDPSARFQSAEEMANALADVGRREDLHGTYSDVREWVKECFASELERRRQLIRESSTRPRRAFQLGNVLKLPDITGSFPNLAAMTPSGVSIRLPAESGPDAPTAAARFVLPTRRRRRILIAVGVGAVVGLVVSALAVLGGRSGDPASTGAGVPAAAAQPRHAARAAHGSERPRSAVAPSGRAPADVDAAASGSRVGHPEAGGPAVERARELARRPGRWRPRSAPAVSTAAPAAASATTGQPPQGQPAAQPAPAAPPAQEIEINPYLRR